MGTPERLRDWARMNPEHSIAPTLIEAADEIERARALLDAVADDIGGDYLDLLAQDVESRKLSR